MLKDFSKEKFDIIIQAGQSNSEGCGLGDASEPCFPNGNIWYLDGNFIIYMAQESAVGNNIIGNFSLSFANEYIKRGKLQQGRKLLIIRSAVGGTGFSDCRWGLKDDLYLRMMEMIKTALNLNPENKLVALLWHQGETDALANASRDTHFKNLSALVESVRDTFNYKNLPFIAGDFVNQWKMENAAICEPVIKAIKDVCEITGNAAFVETSELQSNQEKIGNGDIIHFCREALNIMGVKYFNAFIVV